MNPCLMDKDQVFRLCRQSYWLFKSKWRWRKLLAKTGMTPDELEAEFLKAIEKDDRILKQVKESQQDDKSRSESKSTEG